MTLHRSLRQGLPLGAAFQFSVALFAGSLGLAGVASCAWRLLVRHPSGALHLNAAPVHHCHREGSQAVSLEVGCEECLD